MTSSLPPPLNPGDVLAGKYRIERVLGAGGMGVVVQATHLELHDQVALKFLLPSATDRPDLVERFLREARAAVRIQNEHVARISDVGRLDGGAPYMVMEFLEGGDLSAVLQQRGPLPPSLAVDYVLQACEAIAEAHSLGIVHRDLKPANLFLTRRKNGSELIKVLDFGLAKVLDDTDRFALTNTAQPMGSPLYMSPEQMRSARSVDPRTDIWALGVILYELLCGKTPFEADTFHTLCAAILTAPPLPLLRRRPDLPPGLAAAAMRCLEKPPEARFASIGELAAALAPHGSAEALASLRQIDPSWGLSASPSAASQGPSALAASPFALTSTGPSPPLARKAPLLVVPLALLVGFLAFSRRPEQGLLAAAPSSSSASSAASSAASSTASSAASSTASSAASSTAYPTVLVVAPPSAPPHATQIRPAQPAPQHAPAQAASKSNDKTTDTRH